MVPAFGPNRKTVNFKFPNKCCGGATLNFTIIGYPKLYLNFTHTGNVKKTSKIYIVGFIY